MTIPSIRGECAAALLALACVGHATIATAQTRAAITRNIDNPDLAPARFAIILSLNAGDTEKDVDSITVPAGKRLILDNASVWAFWNNASDVVTGVWLQVKGQTAYTLLDPAINEIRTISSGTVGLAAYNRTIKMTFEAGETVHAYVFFDGTNGPKSVNIYLQGHYVTP
jgi:hypothetical protein